MSTYERWPDPKWMRSYDEIIELKAKLREDSKKIDEQFKDIEEKEIKIKAECFDHPERTYIPLELEGMKKVRRNLQRWKWENAAWERAVDYILGQSFHFCATNRDGTLKEEK